MKRYICFLLLLFLILLGTACRSPVSSVKTSQDLKTESTTQAERQTDLDFRQSIDKAVKATADEIYQRMIDLNWQHDKVNFSPPDSAGKQYPTSTERSTLHQQSQESNQRTEQTDTHYQETTQQITKIYERMERLESLLQNLHTESKKKLPWYQSALMFLGGAFLVYLAIRISIKLKNLLKP